MYDIVIIYQSGEKSTRQLPGVLEFFVARKDFVSHYRQLRVDALYAPAISAKPQRR
jgi:hypothetical protein